MTVTHGFKGADPYITTSTGGRFYLSNPHFDLREMAHALSNTCRFGGHCREFYSVAQHSLLVGQVCARLGLADAREGYLHDGHEAYLGDLPKPWKAAIHEYNTLEGTLELAMRRQFGLSDHITSGCKRADWIALAIEARVLLPNGGSDFAWPEGIQDEARSFGLFLAIKDPTDARIAWYNAVNS